MEKTKEISVFVDESGSFDPDRSSSRYYLVCMVFHNQECDLSRQINILEQNLENMGLPRSHCVHAGPLIRREKEYAHLSRQERRGIFDRMMVFLRTCDIEYTCFKIDKGLIGSRQEIHDPLLQQIVGFLVRHMDDLNTYDVLKVYYDNGQHELAALLKEAFAIYASRTQFVKDVSPERYKLFQSALVSPSGLPIRSAARAASWAQSRRTLSPHGSSPLASYGYKGMSPHVFVSSDCR